MKYRFEGLTSTDLVPTARVVFVLGQYDIFNNIIIDKLRNKTKPKYTVSLDADLFKDFGLEVESDTNGDSASELSTSNTLSLDNFIKFINTPCLTGKWYCNIDISMLSKKQVEWLKTYIKDPSENGVLVITGSDWKTYNIWLNNKILEKSKFSHVVQLSYPNKGMLQGIVKDLFKSRGYILDNRSAELFVMRMSSAYNDYSYIMDRVEQMYEPGEINYDAMVDALKGVENYVIDDFIKRLLIPLKNDTVSGRKKVFKMLGVLEEEYTPERLVYKLRSEIDMYIEFRRAINEGYIPIKVKYSVQESKSLLEKSIVTSKELDTDDTDGSKSNAKQNQVVERMIKLADWRFKQMAYIASQTTLKDWLYMKLILMNTNKFDKNTYTKVLYALVTRTVLFDSRLVNDLGISSTKDNLMFKELNDLDGLYYDESLFQ